MPLIRGSLEHLQPLIPVSVAHPDNLSNRTTVRALIDTGATRTCLTRQLVHSLDLSPRTKMLVAGAMSAPERRWAFSFSFGVFCETEDELGSARTLHVFPGEMVAPDFQDNDNFDVLIGMDLLSGGLLTFRKSGEFTFEFST